MALYLTSANATQSRKPVYHQTIFPLLRIPGTAWHDPTLLGFLAFRLLQAGNNGIVFCASKVSCVKYARHIARVLARLMPEFPPASTTSIAAATATAERHVKPEPIDVQQQRRNMMEELQNTTFALDPTLKVNSEMCTP
jgi:hypothetical protein